MMTVQFLLTIISLQMTLGQWVDPHSMDTNHKRSLSDPHSMDTDYKSKLPKPPHNENPEKYTVVDKDCDSNVHLRRIVRIILNNANLYNNADYHEGYINIRLSAAEHQLLMSFSQSKHTEEGVFSEVSSIFENAFQKPTIDEYQELVLSIQERMYNMIFNPTTTALTGAFVTVVMTYKLLKAHFTWRSIMMFFLFLGYIIDFVVTYIHMVREEEIESMVTIKKLGTAPPECDPKKMSWWEFLKTQLESNLLQNPCRAYYQATYPGYLYVIAPSKILTRQFRTLFVEPCGDIGEAFGKFGRGMFTTLPWGLNVVLFPIMLVTSCAIVFMFFMFITKPQFKICLFHLFSIEFGNYRGNQELSTINNGSNRRQIGYAPNRNRNRRNGNSAREVGAANHRALVEEVSNDNSSSHDNAQDEGSNEISKTSVEKKTKKEKGAGDSS